MRLTPTQRAALLALPFEARMRLAEQESEGGWYHTSGILDVYSRHHQTAERMAAGWAWAPADPLAWMRAATPEGGWWTGEGGGTTEHPDEWTILDDTETIATAPDPITCALRAMGADLDD